MLGFTGFLATALYWPGVSGAATTPRWAALFVIVPYLLRDARKPLLVAGIAAISLLWAASVYDGIGWTLILLLMASMFCLGSECDDLRKFYIGAGLGLWASSALAIGQWLGWHPIQEMTPTSLPSGFFVNGNYLAEAAALVLIAAISERIWWLVPGLLPALLLPHARGAALAAAVAFTVHALRNHLVLGLAMCTAVVLSVAMLGIEIPHDASIQERLLIWQSTWNGLTFFGHGIGSFWTAYPHFDLRTNIAAYPETAHNEFLTIAFELGVPGVIAAVAFCLMMVGPIDTQRLVLIALFVEACFAFPLHLPATATLGMVAAGYSMRNRYLLRRLVLHRRVLGGAGVEGGLRDVFREFGQCLSLRPPFSGRADAQNRQGKGAQ